MSSAKLTSDHPEWWLRELPFVDIADRYAVARGEAENNFWAVRPCGNYSDECYVGACYALELIGMLRQHHQDCGGPDLLLDIARAQPDKDQWSGIETGFWTAISEYLAMGKVWITCRFDAVSEAA